MNLVSMIRGINVGGHNKVPMAELKKLYVELGFTDVRTWLNSGNVMFRVEDKKAKGLEAGIEKAFAERFGFAAGVVSRTAEQLKRAIEECPFVGTRFEEKKVAITFLKQARKTELVLPKGFALHDGAIGTAAGGEEVVFSDDAVFVYYTKGQTDTKFTLPVIEKMVGSTGTARGWGTVNKLLAMVTT